MFLKIINNRIAILYLIPFFLGTISVFGFQPFNFSIINFVNLPILFSLIVFTRKKSKSIYRKKPYNLNLFLIGLTFGFGFFLSGIYWISYSLTFDESFKIFIPFAIILIPLFLSTFFGLTTLLVGQYLKNNFQSILLFSAALSLCDFIRGKIFTGFPWNVWAYSWSWFTEILQSLNFFGLYAFNLLVITIFTMPVVMFFNFSNFKKLFFLSSIFLILFFAYIHGTFVINTNKALLNYIDQQNKVYIKVISPNFELKYNSSIEEIEQKIKKLARYSEPNYQKTTLFIWPEGVFTGLNFKELLIFKKIIKDNFSKNHLIVFGINTIDKNSAKYFNSLVLVNNELEILYQYNKKKLVPFGEHLPFKILLESIGFKKITEGHGTFLKGDKQKNISFDKIDILPLICYEIIFPELTQSSSKKTNLIINISEDGWFGKSIGPHQHFAKAIFRAIENNSFLARSANQGVSAIISNKGKVIKKLQPNETGNIEMDIPLFQPNYKNKNDLIFFILLFTYLIIFLILRIKTNEKK